MQRIFLIGLLFLSFFSSANADVDPFNTYRFNRKNVILNNGRTDTNPWFEWWYYKVVIPESNESFFFVYGIVNPWDKKGLMKGTRSYVGMGDFEKKLLAEEHYGLDSFNARYDETYVSVDRNIATDKYLKGSLKDSDGNNVSWDLSIDKEWTFNATSWATGKMITNIEWYPAQASARCSGSIESAGRIIKFKDAPCYQDRNWGNSFPDWWTWIVSNKFKDNPDTALAIGGGKPTFFGRYKLMKGVAIGLKHEGIEHTWRPNEGDRVKVDIKFGKWEITARNKTHKITVSAYAPKSKFMDLQFVTPTGETFHDYETLTGNVTVKLYKKMGGIFNRKWKLEDTLTSEYTGIEYGSNDSYDFQKFFKNEVSLYKNY